MSGPLCDCDPGTCCGVFDTPLGSLGNAVNVRGERCKARVPAQPAPVQRDISFVEARGVVLTVTLPMNRASLLATRAFIDNLLRDGRID